MTEAVWTQGEDPRRMMRYLLRHPPLRPTSRKAALLGAACARLVWGSIDSDKVRELVECQERCADDLAWLDRYNALSREIVAGRGVPQHPASAIISACPALSIIEAALRVPDITPGSVCRVIRDLFGNPFRQPDINPLWLRAGDGTVRKLAQGIYDEACFDRLPIVADALEEVGCDDQALIRHCRSVDRHFRGCWAIDALLGKTGAEPDQTAWMLRRARSARRQAPRARMARPGSDT
jgi:hypothetical protein